MLTPNINLESKTILVTGAAGFIGANLVTALLNTVKDIKLVGLDNINDYYDVSIKEYRLSEIRKLAAAKPDCTWTFIKGNLADKALIEKIFTESKPEMVVNLAAQAGVRYSITNPDVYVESNLVGFYNILEAVAIIRWSILFMHRPPRFTARIKKFRIRQMIKWTIRYHCMLQPRNPTNSLPMPIPSCTTFHPRDSDFLRSMDRPEDRIWHISVLRTSS